MNGVESNTIFHITAKASERLKRSNCLIKISRDTASAFDGCEGCRQKSITNKADIIQNRLLISQNQTRLSKSNSIWKKQTTYLTPDIKVAVDTKRICDHNSYYGKKIYWCQLLYTYCAFLFIIQTVSFEGFPNFLPSTPMNLISVLCIRAHYSGSSY